MRKHSESWSDYTQCNVGLVHFAVWESFNKKKKRIESDKYKIRSKFICISDEKMKQNKLQILQS